MRVRFVIIVSDRMQETMDAIEQQLSSQIVVEFGTTPRSFIHACQKIDLDSGLALRHERQHVGGAFDTAEPPVRFAHLGISDKPHRTPDDSTIDLGLHQRDHRLESIPDPIRVLVLDHRGRDVHRDPRDGLAAAGRTRLRTRFRRTGVAGLFGRRVSR